MKTMSEAERLAACEKVAMDMAVAGVGWNYDAIERMTRPPLRLPEPTPIERGVLNRYQDQRGYAKRRKH